MGCAVFDYSWRDTLLVGLMLFLPLIDRQWILPKYIRYKYQGWLWALAVAVMSIILLLNPDQSGFLISTILLVALPEEWFFRAYFMQRVESFFASRMLANTATSVLFAALHVPTQGLPGLTVFIPSLVLGAIYQYRQDIVLVIFLHALSNLLYFVYFQDIHL